MSIAYPLAARFRTGTTLAMFTLVVFTLVTGTASNGSFVHAIGVEDFGGGFQVRAGTTAAAPIDDMPAALRRAPGVDARDFTAVGSQSVLAVEASQVGTGRPLETYLVRGLDTPFLEHTTFGLGDIARGYGSAQEVWARVRERPGLAVVDSMIAPRRDNFGTSACRRTSSCPASTSRTAFDPIPVEVPRPADGQADDADRDRHPQGHGAARDARNLDLGGDSRERFPGRVRPTIHYFGLAPGVDPEDAAARPRVSVRRERARGRVDPAGRRRRRRRKRHVQPA